MAIDANERKQPQQNQLGVDRLHLLFSLLHNSIVFSSESLFYL